MSVLIKGMEMPTACAYCELIDSLEICPCYNMMHDEFWANKTLQHQRHSGCPLIEVPPHGRLIDADAVVEDLERQCKEVFRIDAVSPDDYWITRNEAYNEALWKTWVESFDNYLKTRSTVIEASEVE